MRPQGHEHSGSCRLSPTLGHSVSARIYKAGCAPEEGKPFNAACSCGWTLDSATMEEAREHNREHVRIMVAFSITATMAYDAKKEQERAKAAPAVSPVCGTCGMAYVHTPDCGSPAARGSDYVQRHGDGCECNRCLEESIDPRGKIQ